MNRVQKYDIFLSYRRNGGAETAKLMRDSLSNHGYSVFLDVESLRAGPFNQGLYNVIDACRDFILILPPNALDRCVNENDWVRLEIEYAQSKGKNIVPIMLNGFHYPEVMPESLEFLRLQNGMRANMELYDEFIARLERQFLISRPRRRVLPVACAILAAIVLALAVGVGLYARRARPSDPAATKATAPQAQTAGDDDSMEALLEGVEVQHPIKGDYKKDLSD